MFSLTLWFFRYTPFEWLLVSIGQFCPKNYHYFLGEIEYEYIVYNLNIQKNIYLAPPSIRSSNPANFSFTKAFGIAGFVALRRHPNVLFYQSLSKKCFAFFWLFSYAHAYKSELLPPDRMKKACHFRDRLCREEGIRTPDTLPHTRFPSVLLKPLGHLSLRIANVK